MTREQLIYTIEWKLVELLQGCTLDVHAYKEWIALDINENGDENLPNIWTWVATKVADEILQCEDIVATIEEL